MYVPQTQRVTVCAFFSLTKEEFERIIPSEAYALKWTIHLESQGYNATSHILYLKDRSFSREQKYLFEQINWLFQAQKPQFWFFGSDLTKQVFEVIEILEDIPGVALRNYCEANSSLNNFLELFLRIKNVRAANEGELHGK